MENVPIFCSIETMLAPFFFAYLLLFLPPKRWGISLLFWRSERDDREIYASNFSIHQSYLIFLHTVEE